eukprot:361663-Chlamydomonas_euryale.AAC.8
MRVILRMHSALLLVTLPSLRSITCKLLKFEGHFKSGSSLCLATHQCSAYALPRAGAPTILPPCHVTGVASRLPRRINPHTP